MRFSLHNLVLLITIVALAVALAINLSKNAELSRDLDIYKSAYEVQSRNNRDAILSILRAASNPAFETAIDSENIPTENLDGFHVESDSYTFLPFEGCFRILKLEPDYAENATLAEKSRWNRIWFMLDDDSGELIDLIVLDKRFTSYTSEKINGEKNNGLVIEIGGKTFFATRRNGFTELDPPAMAEHNKRLNRSRHWCGF